MKNTRLPILVVVFACCLIPSLVCAGDEPPADIELIMDQKVGMEDGVHLVAKIWKPAEMSEPLPAVYALTPYISDEGQKWGPLFVKAGYVYVHVDTRGRGNSEGEFFPAENDGRDGAQVARWIAKQPWCNGQIGMRGGSYRGMVQWQILAENPGSLSTIVPTASGAPGIDFPWPKNIGVSYFAQWLGYVFGKTENIDLFGDFDYWSAKYYKMYSEGLPFSKLAELTGSNQKIWKRWLAHPFYDEFWEALTPAAEDYQDFDIPILTITGHFDGDQPGAMSYYTRHMRHGSESSSAAHYLVIGPWDHAGTRKPRQELGDLKFGENSVVDIDQLHVDWYDWVLKKKDRPELLKKRVAFYVMNAGEWRYEDRLEDVSDATMSWYLSSIDGEANDVFHSGGLSPKPPAGEQKPDVFTYDPLAVMSWEDYRASALSADPAAILAPDRLVYHSPPLDSAVEVAGFVELKLYLELDVPDTDLGVAFSEIRSDGTEIPLGNDMIRARYRKSLREPELVAPGEIEPYEFTGFYFFARELEQGSRLRLVVGCLDSPNFQRNYNSGGVVADETAEDARTATIKLYHDREHQSVLKVPVRSRD
jgi:putative CocE/NonD family hydrolase